jgi:hypothetical protein
MKRFLCLFSALFLFAAGVYADEPVDPRAREMMPGLRRRALAMDIDARVLEQEQVVVWNETHRKLAIPGSPVGIKLVGSNVAVAVQFTPFIRRHGQNVLVAQGQVWVEVPDEGIRFHTSIQTIPLEFNEPIYFFPLGSSGETYPSIEIMITVNPYTETTPLAAPQAVDNVKIDK